MYYIYFFSVEEVFDLEVVDEDLNDDASALVDEDLTGALVLNEAFATSTVEIVLLLDAALALVKCCFVFPC